MRFAKGHGTGNDFVVLPDPDGRLELTPGLVRRLCDRHEGIGADGVLRAVRATAAGPGALAPATADRGPEWFMDYRNADGSAAEMCGNGIRVFARYLTEHGLAEGPQVAIATRAGTRLVRRPAVRGRGGQRRQPAPGMPGGLAGRPCRPVRSPRGGPGGVPRGRQRGGGAAGRGPCDRDAGP